METNGKFIDLLVKGLSVVAGHNKNIGKVIDLLGNSLDKLTVTKEDSGNVGKAAKAARVLKDDIVEVKSVLVKAAGSTAAPREANTTPLAAPKKANAIPLAAKITLIKLRLQTVTHPAKRIALKAQLKAVKKVLALKRALKNADPE
jgi:hypothetical protein